MFDFIVVPFGWLMRMLYNLVGNYGMALLLFTVITRLLMLPLGISQQKSMAKMSVYNPMIQEIQKKYANNRMKQQEEMTKLYTEYNIKPTTGCLPMLIQFPLIMILYQVIQKPLRYIVGISSDVYNQMIALAQQMGGPSTYQDTFIIGQIQSGNTEFLELVGTKSHDLINNLDFTFLGIKSMDLTQLPTWGWNLLILIPIASAVSMILSQWITGKVTGQKMQGGMAIVMYGMSVWIGYLGFTFPAALSLYWFYSNVLALIQTVVLRKFYNPDKFKAQIQAELDAKRAEKKKKKVVTVTDTDTGEKVEKNLSEAELAKMRLARARALQEEHFRQLEEKAQAKAAEEAAEQQETSQETAGENEQK